jgi:hypothetical protein
MQCGTRASSLPPGRARRSLLQPAPLRLRHGQSIATGFFLPRHSLHLPHLLASFLYKTDTAYFTSIEPSLI